MDSERWRRVEEVFHAVLSSPPEKRAAVLEESCSSDPDLKREVESLLSARDGAGEFLSSKELTDHIADLEPQPSVGSQLGDYEILGVLGAGAMGEVYRARDTRLGREVALKILPPHLTGDAARVARFQAEARAASALNHPNTITIYEIGQASGTWFIAAELVEGITVRERLKEGKIPLAETTAIAIQCTSALQAAHRAGIVHRDIKPENIMIRRDGVVKVVDFGLARILQPRPEWALDATQSGNVMGTPRYMSPEQARGQKPDARSDIFSLGAVLYEMTAGHPAFAGSTTAEVFAALLDSQPDLRAAGAAEGVVSKALEKDREQRYQTIEQFAEDLRRLPKVSGARIPRAPGMFHPRALKIVGAVSLLVLTVLATYAWISSRRNPPAVNFKITKLTTFGGSKRRPAFSPDSRSIAFAWMAPNQETHHIYVKLVAGGEPVQLTYGPEDHDFPVWSPDGRQIAFCRQSRSTAERTSVISGVYLVPASGGDASKIADGCQGLSWSPDGKTLAVARVPNETPDSGGIDLLSIESGQRRRLTQSREDVVPVYSPDGNRLAFIRVVSARGRGREIFVVPLTGGEPRQLTFDGVYATGATWTADSREIIFGSPRDTAHGSLWRISSAGGTPRPLSAALRTVCHPSLSRPGDRMAFVECWEDTNIYLRTSPGFPRPRMPWRWDAPRGIALSTESDHTPSFSPDGERVAFTSDRLGNRQIWVSRRDGSEARQLTSFSTESAGSPSWSPDGAWIAFDLWASNESNVYVVSSGGGPPRRLSMDPGESWNPIWSQDGGWIYFDSRRSGPIELWRIPAAGGEAVKVTGPGAFDGRASLDGKIIYFRKSTSSGCCSIWSVSAGGGPEQPVRELEGFTTVSRSWGVLKEGIYFIAREKGPEQSVRFLSFATRAMTEILRLEKEPDWNFGALALSPDGRSLLTVEIDREVSDLTMVENFR